MGVAGQVHSVTGEEPDIVAIGAQGETVWTIGGEVEGVSLVKYDIAKRWNGRIGWDDVFLRGAEVIAQEPTANIHGAGSWVVELNGVRGRRLSFGHDFIDEHVRNS